MSTTNHTANYGLSQYAAGDPVKFLTNYNQDMAAIDAAVKAAADSADAKTPLTRTVAGIPLSGDIAMAQLTSAGLAAGDGSGNAQNALKLGGITAGNYPQAESGTWTPTLFGSTTPGTPVYTTQSGTYYRTGKLVIITFQVVITSLGGMAGDVYIGGLPFAAVAGRAVFGNTSGLNLPSGNSFDGGQIVGSSSISLQAAGNLGSGMIHVEQIADSFHMWTPALGIYLTA